MAPALSSVGTTFDNSSSYTLRPVRAATGSTPDPRSPLISPTTPTYGTSPARLEGVQPPRPSNRPLLIAFLKMSLLFLTSSALLGGTLWLALPTLEEEDRPLLRIPKSFAQLQALNSLLKKYRDIYPYRIFISYVTTYLFLQAFSLPGSMYLSILGGAVWGVTRALPLACACVATGATLCYLISAALGPALLSLPKWRSRFDKLKDKVSAQRDNIMSFLIVLRIAPLPPHWMINMICPHVGIGVVPFWCSTFLGILGVTVIHTTIGGGLDEMTSEADFHLISWRNFFWLSAVVVAVMIPVGLRYYFKRNINFANIDIEQPEEGGVTIGVDGEEELEEDRILAMGPPLRLDKAKKNAKDSGHQLVCEDSEEDEYTDGDEDYDSGDSDVILEEGPALAIKSVDEPVMRSRC